MKRSPYPIIFRDHSPYPVAMAVPDESGGYSVIGAKTMASKRIDVSSLDGTEIVNNSAYPSTIVKGRRNPLLTSFHKDRVLIQTSDGIVELTIPQAQDLAMSIKLHYGEREYGESEEEVS